MVNNYLELLQRHLSSPRRPGYPLPGITCADGFTMSVQAGLFTYCSPRNDVGPWVEVEVGYPSSPEPMLFEYAETPGDWTNTVYPYTPVQVVANVIEVHGGFKEEAGVVTP